MVSRTMGVSRAQLSLRINRSADWQDRRCNRRNEEADAEILSAILNIIVSVKPLPPVAITND